MRTDLPIRLSLILVWLWYSAHAYGYFWDRLAPSSPSTEFMALLVRGGIALGASWLGLGALVVATIPLRVGAQDERPRPAPGQDNPADHQPGILEDFPHGALGFLARLTRQLVRNLVIVLALGLAISAALAAYAWWTWTVSASAIGTLSGLGLAMIGTLVILANNAAQLQRALQTFD